MTDPRTASGNGHHDHRHRRHAQTRATEPVYLSRAQRVWLARLLANFRDMVRGQEIPEALRRDEIKMAGSISARIREARTDG